MPIPSVSRDAIAQAMENFDRELRETPQWSQWQNDRAFKYAISWNERLYPVKQIVSIATRHPTQDFSGGIEVNSYVQRMGFSIVNMRADPIRENLERVLMEYETARTRDPFGSNHPVWSVFENLEKCITETDAVRMHPTLNVIWSAGQGNWATVPWIAILDSRETDEPREGIYCVFLFRQDMSGVYLTLNQGVLKRRKELGRSYAHAFLQGEAKEIREAVPELKNHGFALDDGIDLRAELRLGNDYSKSTIAYKLYEKSQVPKDEILEADLENVLDVYVRYISQEDEMTKRSWVFQASPKYYDILGAMEKLKQQTWSVAQFKDQIHINDRVFVWEAGQDAGIVGVATVLTEPAESTFPEEERPFVKDVDKFSGVHTSVRIRVDRILSERVRRVDLQKDAVLKDLSVILFPRATNFTVTKEQAKRLEEILDLHTETQETITEAKSSVKDRFAEITQKTFLSSPFFEDLERLLLTKRQIILQGAPGSGKTFVAEEFANWWTGSSDRVRTVQLHESYGYEDFVQGIKPKVDEETHQTNFQLTDGPFMAACKLAGTSPHERYVLVIDEINRAKAARVFGELLYLLEYRDKGIILQSGSTFSIPSNLYVIGTMNTVDKSIALVDFALRRRFAFVTLRPVVDGKSTVLLKWLERNQVTNAKEVDQLFLALNKVIAAKSEDLMLGHSYFMSAEISQIKTVTNDTLEFIWLHYILPLMAEYEYDLNSKQVEDKYGLPAIRNLATKP